MSLFKSLHHTCHIKYFILTFFLQLFISPLPAQVGDRGTVPVATVQKINTSYALVTGVSAYAHIPQLQYADKDAYLFKEYLLNNKVCQTENISLLIDEAATTAGFFRELKRILGEVKNGDRVFIYFAGHGDVEAEIETGFLLPYNCEANNYSATSIDLESLEKYVNALVKKEVQVILVLDACRSGKLAGGSNGVKFTMGSFFERFQKTIKLLSCQPNQLSKEMPFDDGGHGIFTYHLVKGLAGDADKNKDGQITVREISTYLELKVSEQTNDSQVPKVEGDLQSVLVNYEIIHEGKIAKSEKPGAKLMKMPKPKKETESNRLFLEFKRSIESDRIYIPDASCAYSIYEDALIANESPSLLEEMRNMLTAGLESAPQEYINRYIKGELEYNIYKERENLQMAYLHLEKLLELTSSEDFRYNELKAKQLFFESLIILKYNQRERYSLTITNLMQADSLLPKKAWINNLLGLSYYQLKDWSKADSFANKAKNLSPSWAMPWNLKGNILILQKMNEEAAMAYRQAIKLDSNFSYAWNNLGTVYGYLDSTEQAIIYFNRSVAINPYSSETFNNLGSAYFRIKNDSLAEISFRKAIMLDSLNLIPQYFLANLLAKHERIPEAITIINNAVRLNDTNPDFWYLYAVIYCQAKEYPTAISALQKAIGLGFKEFKPEDGVWDPVRDKKEFKNMLKK